VVVEGEWSSRVERGRGFGFGDELGHALDERPDLSARTRRGEKRGDVAAQDRRTASCPVRRTRRTHTPGDRVAQRGKIESGAQVTCQACQRGNQLGVNGLSQADPHVAAASGAGLAHHRVKAHLGGQGRDRAGITLRPCGRAGGLGIKIERQEPEPTVRSGEIDRPRKLRFRPTHRALPGVVVRALST